MSAKDRAASITKLYKFVKKEYDVHPIPSDRTVLEHMLYACCLQDSTYEAADECLAKLQENYFDWNEVRVTTVQELAEVCKRASDPMACADRVKKSLYGVFENFYQFDLEFLKKENLSKAVMQMSKFKGMSPFVVSYVAQMGLGGHRIPLDASRMLLFHTLGIAGDADVKAGRVPGLERVIAKNKGIEFSALVHYLAVRYSKSPFNKDTRNVLLKLAKDAADRFPKRISKKKREEEAARIAAEEKAAFKAEQKAAKEAKQAEIAAAAAKKKAAKKGKKAAAAPKAKAKPVKVKPAKAKPAKKKAAKPAKPAKKAAAKKPTKKKAAAKPKASKKAAKKKPAKKAKKATKKKSSSKNLKKKKPR